MVCVCVCVCVYGDVDVDVYVVQFDDIPVDAISCPDPCLSVCLSGLIYRRDCRPATHARPCVDQLHRPTPVLKYSIPIGVMCCDMMGCVQSGSGEDCWGSLLFSLITVLLKKGAKKGAERALRFDTHGHQRFGLRPNYIIEQL